MKWTLKKACQDNSSAENGISLPELAAVIAIVGITGIIVAPSISFGRDALKDSGSRIENLLKLARSRSMAQTSAYKISPRGNNELKIEYSNTCNSPSWKDAQGFSSNDLKLDQDVTFSAAVEDGVVVIDPGNDWSVCFNSRGYADKILGLTIFDAKKNETQQFQVFRGGTVSVL